MQPVLLGTTDNEGDLILFFASGSVNQTLSDQMTAALFTCPDSQQAKYVAGTLSKDYSLIKNTSYSSSAGVPTYRYRYMPTFPAVSPPPLRAYHSSELPILFDTIGDGFPFTLNGFSSTPPPTELENAATKYMGNAWAAFITDPANGLKSLDWPLYRGPTGGKTLVEIFPSNNVQNPILLEDPMKFDATCPM
jgi:carboxylesterase type B